MKLDIQLFTDGDLEIKSIAEMQQIGNDLQTIKDSTLDILNNIVSIAKNSANSDLYTPKIRDDFSEVSGLISKYGNDLSVNIDTIGKTVGKIADVATKRGTEFINNLGGWLDNFKSNYGKLESAYTGAGVEKGSYSATSYANDVADSVNKMDAAGKVLVNETVNILANTGKVIKSGTGLSVQDIVQKSVGTFNTLLTSVTESGGTASRILGNIRAFALS